MGVWVLISDSLLEGSHGLFGRYGFGSDDVGYLEVQGDVLPVTTVNKGCDMQAPAGHRRGRHGTHKLLLVAFSICSSRAVLAEDDHQLIMVAMGGSGPGA